MWPPWRCTAGAGDDILVARVNKDNDAECWSSNKYNCLWLPNLTVCDATLRNLTKAAALAPLSCGRVYNTMWGEPGYSNPGHWCAKVARMWSLQHTPTPFVCAPVSNPPVVVYAVRRNSMRHVECFHGIDVEGCAAFATVQECQDQVALLESGGAAAQTTTCSSYSNLSHWYDGVFWRFLGDRYQGTPWTSPEDTAPTTYDIPSSLDWGVESTRVLLRIPSVGVLFCRGLSSDGGVEWNATMACIAFDATTGAVVNSTAYMGELGRWFQYVY
ncbi:hypothetical protein DYB32_004238 [Aphanomyces invadans]|uniref:Uncharacterized protein n=1 Tax=Aphanomyces invadans TaxID=157072 RepID=A0A418AY76_9STRA|nr:hypothetical protein DYB32_004238 [Aphanomyces invadans]